ncbi:MAG TPA: hypothetical protein PKY78_08365 [Candidatus Omnitrophota bacterium]|nr:hypothetical protein [Candidatus Omnitrophota bacterium]HPS20983.1 hypothetical protein [Candidatus Omnitrophota bacterium]
MADNKNKHDKPAKKGVLAGHIEAQRKRAQDLGLAAIIGNLWDTRIQYYPSLIKNGGVTPLITRAEELEKEQRDGREWRRVRFIFKGREYICAFEEHRYTSYNVYRMATVEVYAGGQKVVSIKMSLHFHNVFDRWGSFEIERFVEGDWVNDFFEINDIFEREKMEYFQSLSSEAIRKLRENYGIDNRNIRGME